MNGDEPPPPMPLFFGEQLSVKSVSRIFTKLNEVIIMTYL